MMKMNKSIRQKCVTQQLFYAKINESESLNIGGSGVRLYDGPDIKLFIYCWLRPELLVCCLALRASTGVFSFAPGFSKLFRAQGQLTESVESSFLIHQGGYHDFFFVRP